MSLWDYIEEGFSSLGDGIAYVGEAAYDRVTSNASTLLGVSAVVATGGLATPLVIKALSVGPISNVAESLVDNVLRDKVQPVPGSVVYTDLAFGYAEHSGIYVGDGRIVELNSKGDISVVTPRDFISGGSGVSIYVSCKNGAAVGGERVAAAALRKRYSKRDYNLILDNCHQFTSGCLTGKFENSDNFLMFLKQQAKESLGATEWRVWDIDVFA